MKALMRTALGRLGLLEPVRELRRAAVHRLLGRAPHKPTETRRYWESRGRQYRDQVQSIFTDGDPYAQAQQELLQELAAIPWQSLLEVGCGFGWHLRTIQLTYPDRRITGTDFSWSQLEEGREYVRGTGVALGQADARRLPFPDNSVDLVLTSGLLVCIHADELAHVLGELKRVTRRSVVLLEYAREHMDLPARRALMDQADWHGHNYSRALAEAGLRLVKAFPFRAFEPHPDRVPLSLFHAEKA
jgi:ubiquinone/menaquinone biosynthesis C-methylase UbiE